MILLQIIQSVKLHHSGMTSYSRLVIKNLNNHYSDNQIIFNFNRIRFSIGCMYTNLVYYKTGKRKL